MSLTEALPHLNAILNAVASVFLAFGYHFIRNGQIERHRACMVSAAMVSAVFLVSYLAHRANAPILVFRGPDSLSIPYYTLLISHVSLSVAIVPLVALTLWRAFKGRFEMHRKVARLAWPAWMYVSISGIAVYIVLYQVYPA
jgi:putative membrane protein